jgi:hypothetical protein
MIIEALNAKRSFELGEPMALHSSSCSWDTSKHPGQDSEEGSRSGGERRGGVATRAGEPEAGHSCEPPGPGGIEAKSTATAAVGIPQSPHDHHLPAAFAAAAARFFAPSDSECSMLHISPSTHEPLRKSGQTPEAGAPGLAARAGFLSFHAW